MFGSAASTSYPNLMLVARSLAIVTEPLKRTLMPLTERSCRCASARLDRFFNESNVLPVLLR
jgi:hypothetical protein